MPDEPDNLTNRLLREIRTKLDDHDTRFDRIDAQIVALGEEMAATRSVLIDVVVQLTARLTRLENEKA